jgi:glycosyltransferase involved in cell wall biosynthesis
MESSIEALVSVIIPCYNDYKYINEAIRSINNQTYKNVEIIIIDDGSDLQTKEVLKNIFQENLTIIYQKNLGPSAARNNGIKSAKGDFILTLDADDYFEPIFVEKAINCLEKNRKAGLISCWIKILTDEKIVEMFKPAGGDLKTLIQLNGASAGSVLFRKKCWQETGGYDEQMTKGYEDWEFNLSVVKAGWDIIIIEDFLFNYRRKKVSRNSEANKLHKYELWKYIYLKHQDLWSDYHELMINRTFMQMEILEKATYNLRKSIDYRVGKLILAPFRFIKKCLKKN